MRDLRDLVVQAFKMRVTQVTPRLPDWVPVGTAPYQNCTHYAFDGYDDLIFEQDLHRLLEKARALGWKEVSDPLSATVLLYGKSGRYNHAIRRVDSQWRQFHNVGYQIWEWMGGPVPPCTFGDDDIIAMLEAP